MPFKSPQQRRFMEGAAHDPGFAQRAGIKQSVAQKFVNDSNSGMLPKPPSQPKASVPTNNRWKKLKISIGQ